MKLLSFLLITGLLVSISFAQKKLGKEITLKEKTSISKIVDNPKDFIGKKVLIEGTVKEVCPKAGCWMILQDNDKEIKVKVKDGEIVFPKKGVGGTALVEGEVYELNLTKEEAVEYYQHIADETKTKFDPATVTGPVTLYQVKGLGAEVTMPKKG